MMKGVSLVKMEFAFVTHIHHDCSARRHRCGGRQQLYCDHENLREGYYGGNTQMPTFLRRGCH